MAYARITVGDDDSTVELEVGDDGHAHPDLLDELASRVLVLWRETCMVTPSDEGDE